MRNKKTTIKVLAYMAVGLLFTILTSTSKSSSEQNRTIDSLKTIIETADHDTTRAKALNALAWKLQYNKPDTAFILAEQLLQLYQKTGDQKGISNAYNSMGDIKDNISEYDKALKYYNMSLKIRESLGDKKGMASSYNNIGLLYAGQSDYSLALDYYFKSLKIDEELGNKKGMTSSYNNIGNTYIRQSDYPLALDYHFKSLKIKEELGNKQGMAMSYNNIGVIYDYQSDYPLALDYYFKSLKIEEELGNKQGMAYSYGNIGNFYKKQSDYALALDYYSKTLKISEELGDKQSMATSYVTIGMLYTALFDKDTIFTWVGEWATDKTILLDTALSYQQKALAIYKELSDEYYMTYNLSGIASIHVKKGEYSYAIEYYQQAALLADSIGALQRESKAHSGLAECYEKLGNHKLALEHYKQYSTLKDSVFNEEKSKDIGKLEAGHEYEKQMLEQEKEHEKQQALAAAELKRQRIIGYSFIGGFVLVLILAFVIYRSFRQKKKANQLLEEKNEIIEEKNKDITDSIRYAQNIQEAILPNAEEIKKALPDHFIYFQPRDIVSGDFYWFAKQNGKTHIAACDCTGHGVPGAFVSMIGNDLLNQIIIEKGLEKPGDILTQLNNGVKSVFTREGTEQQAQDGMDMALCVFDKDLKTLEFTGANNPLLLIQNGELKRIKGDKHAIGGDTEIDYNFTNHKIDLQKGNIIYIFSDGYQDQFGGVRNKKFGTKRFREFLFSIQDKSMQEQKEILNKTIEDWKGDGEQIDDILIIGVRV